MKFIPRLASTKLTKYLLNDKVIIILGARQVGKTTLVEQLVKGKKVTAFNLDFMADRQKFSSIASLEVDDAMNVLNYPEILVIDEAQNLPETGKIIKAWHDKKLPFKVILMGSSTLDLLDVTAEPLTGRNEKINLPPLLFNEVIQAQDWYPKLLNKQDSLSDSYIGNFLPTWQKLMMERMVFGSYPEAITTADKKTYLGNLVNDYLFRDTLRHGLVSNQEQLLRLLQLLAHQVGNEVSINELSNTLGLSRPAIERSLDLLEKSFVIFHLSAFSRNPRNEIMGKKKYYFFDTGVRNELLREFSQSEVRPDIGALWENWVVAEIMKQQSLKGYKSNVEFWRNRNGSEVDLVIRENDQIWAYEIKWNKSKVGSGRSFFHEYGVKVQIINKDNALKTLFHLPF